MQLSRFPHMKEIKLTQGRVCLVSDEDFDELSKFNWHYTSQGYASRRDNGKNIYLHRQLMNFPEGLEVDHINGNTLDNTRENLRVCTHKQNISNSKIRSNMSGFKGVRWNGNVSKWQVRVHHNSKEISVGYFKDKLDAAKAYNNKALELFGEYARLNTI